MKPSRNIRSAVSVAIVLLVAVPLTASAQSAAYGALAYVPNAGSPGSVSVIDTATGNTISTIATGPPSGVAITPDGTRAYVVTDGEIKVIDTSNQSIVATITCQCTSYGAAISPYGGGRLYVGSGNDVKVINTGTNQIIATISGFNAPTGFAVSPVDYKV